MKAIEWNDSGDGDDREEELISELISPAAVEKSAAETLKKAARAVLRSLGDEP
jgi:hypothetical protein